MHMLFLIATLVAAVLADQSPKWGQYGPQETIPIPPPPENPPMTSTDVGYFVGGIIVCVLVLIVYSFLCDRDIKLDVWRRKVYGS
jgi:hypothetical protein